MSGHPKEWVTYSEAATLFQRSKRTIRRWVADPRNRILSKRAHNDVPRIRTADLDRVDREKNAYRDAPTFGRNNHANVTNVTALE